MASPHLQSNFIVFSYISCLIMTIPWYVVHSQFLSFFYGHFV